MGSDLFFVYTIRRHTKEIFLHLWIMLNQNKQQKPHNKNITCMQIQYNPNPCSDCEKLLGCRLTNHCYFKFNFKIYANVGVKLNKFNLKNKKTHKITSTFASINYN